METLGEKASIKVLAPLRVVDQVVCCKSKPHAKKVMYPSIFMQHLAA